MLTRLHKDTTRSTSKRPYYFFKCDCGEIVSKRSDSKIEYCSSPTCTLATVNRHGKSHTRLFSIWSGMRDRCINGNHASSVHYKDRGITICNEWDLFVVFEKWALSNGYTDTLTLDRIDITQGYSVDNCEWVTRAENTKRQVQDYHGNHQAIIAFNATLEISFKSVRDCAKYIIDQRLSKSTNVDSVASIVSTILRGSYKSDTAYGLYFKEAK